MLILLAVFCTLCEAVFTALEVALGAVSRARLRALLEDEAEREQISRKQTRRETNDDEENSPGKTTRESSTNEENAEDSQLRRRADRLLRVLDNSDRLTLAFIIVTALSLWTAASALTWQAMRDDWTGWSLALSLLGVLFVAEALPVLFAARNPESVALRGVHLAEISLVALWPLIALLGGLGQGVARLLGAQSGLRPQLTEGELRTALAAAEEEGVIESEERALLEGAMEFREKLVREVMTPRPDMVAVPASMPLDEVLRVAIENGHSRLPVYEGTRDKIIGIVSTKDLIPYLRAAVESTNGTTTPPEPMPHCAAEVARPAFFVPETKRIAATLDELRRQRTLLAVVVDEDGGTAGLVTLEDLLEEIVGEIQDEYDREEPALRVGSSPDAPDVITGTDAAPPSPASTFLLAQGNVTVRDCERFWRRNFEERITLCETSRQEGSLNDVVLEPADASLSLAALAFRLFDGVPAVGDRTQAGLMIDRDLVADFEWSATRQYQQAAPIDIEIMAMDGPRIGEIKIEKSLLPETSGDETGT